MLRSFVFIFACLQVFACGQECSRESRDGSYRAVFAEDSGNCGPIDSAVIQMNGGDQVADPGCTFRYERWSEDECTFESSYSCPLDNGNVIYLVGSSTQEDGDGAELAGTADVTLKDSQGQVLCHSLYDVTFTRI